MTDQLWSPERRAAAQAEARRWAGTRHRHRVELPGRGIDCVRFVVRILIAADIADETDIPSYPLRWGLCSPRNIMEDLFLRCLHAEPATDDPRFGDLVVFRCGRQTNHCGVLLGDGPRGAVWHVGHRHRCGPSRLDMIRPDLQSLVRIRRPGLRERPDELDLSGIQ